MTNQTVANLFLQAMFYLVTSKQPSFQSLNVTLLDPSITDPLFENDTIKCYGIYGCFPIDSPWKDVSRPVSNFPDPPNKIDPTYCLLTRYNPTKCQYIYHFNRSTIYQSFFTPFHKTYFVAHGFLESGERPWMKNMARQLLQSEDANVFIVDWGKGSVPPYTQAVANTRLVGKITAFLIYTLKVVTGAQTENMHFIGHSLGAHTAGYIGNTLKEHFNCTLGRITGMDPAEPHFSQTNPVVRLDTTDASFVDVIHTNIKNLMKGGFGMDEAIGHIDFYPNGGDGQPGCGEGMMKFYKQQNQSAFHGLREFLSCDHVRSHEFFLDSINKTKCTFLGIECKSWEDFLEGNCFPCKSEQNPNGHFCAHMGKPSIDDWKNSEFNKLKREPSPIKLYTITTDTVPFCATLYRVNLNISNSLESVSHKGEVGVFFITILGNLGSTQSIKVFSEQYFAPGSSHQRVIGGANVGAINSAILYWDHPTTMNLLTWRIDPVIHIGSVLIETFMDNQKIMLCPLHGEVLGSKRSAKMTICS